MGEPRTSGNNKVKVKTLPGNIVRRIPLPALPMHCGIGANSRNIFSFEDIVVTLCVATFRVKKIATFCDKKLSHFASKVVTFRVDVTFCVESCYVSR